MLTVLEAIKLSTEYLEKKKITSARTNAELLLSGILKCKRLDLYLKFDKPLSESEKNQYREFIARRGKFEPLQYIIGETEFYGLPFKVNPDVLIPRQETEILIEAVLEDIKANNRRRILDIGTGSGIIPITIAKNFNIEVFACDISEKALTTASVNAKLNNVENKITFFQHDVFNEFDSIYSDFDLIISNPPYISEKDYSMLQKELFFEPKIALSDFNNGYKFYERIAKLSLELLKPKGRIYFESGDNQANKIKNILTLNKYTLINSRLDYLNIERIVWGEKH